MGALVAGLARGTLVALQQQLVCASPVRQLLADVAQPAHMPLAVSLPAPTPPESTPYLLLAEALISAFAWRTLCSILASLARTTPLLHSEISTAQTPWARRAEKQRREAMPAGQGQALDYLVITCNLISYYQEYYNYLIWSCPGWRLRHWRWGSPGPANAGILRRHRPAHKKHLAS